MLAKKIDRKHGYLIVSINFLSTQLSLSTLSQKLINVSFICSAQRKVLE